MPVEIETIGANGLRLRLGGNRGTGEWNGLRAFSAPVLLDAAGAGDWTTAGIIHSLVVRGMSAEQAVANFDAVVSATKFGQALAAINCGFEGARGLMYVATARRVLKLACTVSKGSKLLSLDEIQSITGAEQSADGNVDQACENYQDLHF